MIIPIGHEQDSVRRLPWVAFSLMIACGVAFVLSGELGDTRERDGKATERALPAIQYYLEHPYLELDPEMEAMISPSAGEGWQTMLEIYRSEFPAPADPEALADEQRELDRLTESALRGVGEHPYFRWGLVPARPSPIGLLTHMFLHGGIFHLLGNMLIL